MQRGIELLDTSRFTGRGTVEIRSVAPAAPAALQGSCEDAVTLLLAQNASLSGDLALSGGASLLLDPPEPADGHRELTLSGGGHTLVLDGAGATLHRIEWAGADAPPGAASAAESGFDALAVVVTRYYGGTQLGTGGLIRAYGGAAAKALESNFPSSEISTIPERSMNIPAIAHRINGVAILSVASKDSSSW